jgi:hypothetical protein
MKKPHHALGVAGEAVKKSYTQSSFILPPSDFQPRVGISAPIRLNYLLTPNLALLQAALLYAGQDVPVLPLHGIRNGRCTCGTFCGAAAGAHPRVAGSFRAATANLPQIRKWWRKWPDSNIGIATGAASGLVVMNVGRLQGIRTLQSLVARHGALPETATARSPDSWQFYFRIPEGCESLSCTLRDGIEFCADAGYAVAPPSRLLSGVYEWC